MNAAVIWIIAPAVLSILLFALQKNRVLVVSLAAVGCVLLSFLAALVPIGEAFKVGTLTAQIPSTLTVLGRQFILVNGDRAYLALIYGFGAVWFIVGGITLAQRFFAPMGLAMIVVLVAAFAVEPFFYAALLVETAVLLSIPILSSPGASAKKGVQRYLIFQTLAMPFILMAGWILGLGEANPTSVLIQTRAALFLALGFAFWLAIFPFHSWMPLLAKEAHPFPVGFVLSLLPIAVVLLFLDFLNGFGWLRGTPQLYDVLKFIGVLMVVMGGVSAAVQRDISRLLGFAVIFETGYALIGIGLHSLSGLIVFAASLLPRLLGVIVFVIALSVLANQQVGFSLESLRGLVRRYPFVAIGLLIAYGSMGGLPLLAGFPVRQETLELLAGQSFALTAWAAVGSLAFLLGGARILVEIVQSEETDWKNFETVPQRILLTAGILFIILFGLFPNTFVESVLTILRSFPVLLQ